jgi:acyl-homoserine lactone synthase
VLPHMLSEHFAYLVQRTIPKENDLLELTRFAIHKSQRGSPHYFELLTAIQEYGLRERLAGYTAIINTQRLPILQSFGFDIEPLGLPQTVGSETMIAVLFRVSQDCLSSVRRLVNVHSSVLDDMTAQRRIA